MASPGPDGSPTPVEAALPADDIPLALPAPPPTTQPPVNPRRLPPPCWSHDETVALIDAYRDKWYALRRGNLKANHWQEVADAVGRKCPGANPPKTAVQCRHKMEKLRKRYRTEIQRARSMPVSRFSTSWVHFKRMDAMEKGPQLAAEEKRAGYNSESDGGEDNDDDDDDNNNFISSDGGFHNNGVNNPAGLCPESYKNGAVFGNARSVHKLYNNRNGMGGPTSLSGSGVGFGGGGGGSGFRIRIPTGVSIAQPAPTPPLPSAQKFYAKVNLVSPGPGAGSNSNVKANFGGGVGVGMGMGMGMGVDGGGRDVRGGLGGEEMGKKRERDPMEEMVAAIKLLGDGFVRMEQMKMEMAREMETMRMETEMKRTEMILESQQRIVEAFAKAFSEKRNKKQMLHQRLQPEHPKRVPSPPES